MYLSTSTSTEDFPEMYLSTFQVLYKLYLSTDVLKYKVLLPGSDMNMLFCILFRYLDFSIKNPLLVGERSLDATAGNPQSVGNKVWHKRCAARTIGVHDRPWHINVPKSHFYELIL